MNWLLLLLVLHLAGMTLWLGGMVMALLIMRPGTGSPEAHGQLTLQKTVFHRLFALMALVMPLTLASGWIMAFLAYGRPQLWPWPLNAMQTAGLAMGGLFLLMRFGPFAMLHEAYDAHDKDEIIAQSERISRLIAISCGLSGVALIFGALLQD